MKTLDRENLVTLIVEKDKSSAHIGLIYVAPQTKKLGKGRGKNSMVNTIGMDSEKILKHTKASFQGGGEYKKRDANWRAKNEMPEASYEGGEDWAVHYIKHTEYLVEHRTTGHLYIRLYDYMASFRKPEYSYEGKKIDIKDHKFDPFRKKPGTPGIIRQYRFDRIEAITVDGIRYRVKA